jgi:hypothetical protein
MPRIRKPSNMGEPFGVRLTTDALVAVDELADVWKMNRQEALRRIVDAGLAACGRSDGPPGVGATLDLVRLAAEAARGAAEAVLAAGKGGASGSDRRTLPDRRDTADALPVGVAPRLVRKGADGRPKVATDERAGPRRKGSTP